MNETESREYRVDGMSCGHCAASVAEEVAEVQGVEDAEVVLGAQLLRVRGINLSDEVIGDAVESAGYRVGSSA